MVDGLWAKELVIPMIIKKNTLYTLGTILIIIMGIAFLSLSSSNPITGSVVYDGEAQIVKLSVVNGQYVFEPTSVKKGIPVRLEADISSMPGCSKSVISSELGIRKTFSSNDNSLEFNPSKAGTFYFACSMNMYKGTLTVLESDGSKSNYVQTPSSSGASCGSSGGGCGCGS